MRVCVACVCVCALVLALAHVASALQLRDVAMGTLADSDATMAQRVRVYTRQLDDSRVVCIVAEYGNGDNEDGSSNDTRLWCTRDSGNAFVQQQTTGAQLCGERGTVHGTYLYCPEAASATWLGNSTLSYTTTSHSLLDKERAPATPRNVTVTLGANASRVVRALRFSGNVLTPSQRSAVRGDVYHYTTATLHMHNDTRVPWLLRSRDGFAWATYARLPLPDTHPRLQLRARGSSTFAVVATRTHAGDNNDATASAANVLTTTSHDAGKHWTTPQPLPHVVGDAQTATAVHTSGVTFALGFDDTDDLQLHNVVLPARDDDSDNDDAATTSRATPRFGTRALAEFEHRNVRVQRLVAFALFDTPPPQPASDALAHRRVADDSKLLVVYRDDMGDGASAPLEYGVYTIDTSDEWDAYAAEEQRKRAAHEAAVRARRAQARQRARRERQRAARELRDRFARDDAAAVARARDDAAAAGDDELVLVRRVDARTAHLEKDTFLDEL